MTTLTSDAVLAVADALGVQTLPAVLALRPRQTEHARLLAARAAVLPDLRERGLLDHDGNVLDDDLTTALFALARPERQLVLRIRREGTVHRLCLVRRGLDHAVAIRVGEELDVRTVWGDEDPAVLARPLLTALGSCPPADIPVLTAATAELRRRFDDGETGHTSVAYHLGMSEADAVTLGSALRQWNSLAELVCYSYRDGRAARSPATAAVYDTAVGRIIGGGSVAADGRAWTTLAPGSDRRFAHVIAAQIESLREGRWMP
ncbi:ESX secretion-associated protein EspG [Nocardia sp. NBC_01503]|uniref:ESX secretion-associated protein EspG n=1 Tax=Nocardia sp. NBC_01503 TaxID=2975997 RepID=UPI002E7C364E|nr:ESX secretion-associated protein EspG [Nocardia sp. NBC_01503]WTL29557.1 ESX secretion-associated protein EspG [Nocardia sp. NBC_01503]